MRSREATERAFNLSRSPIKVRMACAIISGEREGTRIPDSLSTIKSLAPGISVTMQGTPQAIASRTTLGEASLKAG